MLAKQLSPRNPQLSRREHAGLDMHIVLEVLEVLEVRLSFV
jgi:hypothetical protein